MGYRFTISNRQNVVLVHDNKIIDHVDKIGGFVHVREMVLDTAVERMTQYMQAQGVDVNERLKAMNTPKVEEPIQAKTTELVSSKPSHSFAEVFLIIVITLTWIMGIVVTPGWWKVLASCFPPYAWYNLCSVVMKHYSLIV